MYKIFLMIIISLLLFNCTTTYKLGEKFNTESVKSIIIEKTTQEEILSLFEEPFKKGLINGNEVYIYTYEEVAFEQNDYVNRKGNTLVVEFNENKIVKNYYFNIPGKEPVIIGLLIHKREKEKQAQQQAMMQNQMMTPQVGPF